MEVLKDKNEGLTKDDFTKNVIYLGIQGKENVEKALGHLSKEFPDKHIYIMDKQMFSNVGGLFVEQHLKWKEEQKLANFVNDPEKSQQAMQVMMKIVEKIGENKWFYLKDVVDETNMDYKQAQSTLNLLFAFGMAAHRADPEQPTRMQWCIIKDEEAKLKYVDDLATGLETEAKQLRDTMVMIKKGIDEGKKKKKPVKDNVAKKKKK